MKIRKIIVLVIILIITGLLFIVGNISYQSGVNYGETNAEEIRSAVIKNVENVISKKYASVDRCAKIAMSKSRVEGFTFESATNKCFLYKKVRSIKEDSGSVSGTK